MRDSHDSVKYIRVSLSPGSPAPHAKKVVSTQNSQNNVY